MARLVLLVLTLVGILGAQETRAFTVRGEIRSENQTADWSDYEVEIHGAAQYSPDRVPVGRDGSFELPKVVAGSYELRIVTRRGDEVARQFLFLQPNEGPISWRLPQAKAEKPGGAINIAALGHRVPRAAARELERGVKLARRGRQNEALGHFRKAVALDPGFAAAHHQLGYALFTRHAPEFALPEFEAVMRLRPELPEAHVNLAVTLLALGRVDEAEAEAQKALAMQRNYPRAEEVVRLCQVRRGRQP